MEKLIDICSYPIIKVLDLLLQDKSTKKNIIWATDSYEEFGTGFSDKEQIDANVIKYRNDIIRPRIQKSLEAQAQRTRKKAEVFTPAWLCNTMNNHCDCEWFGRKGVFNTENDDRTWSVTEEKIKFPTDKTWQNYVDSRKLEITCGEAPYLVSRYDVSTGEFITPPMQRIGILDRKLRIVNENTDTYEDWEKWTVRAFESCYGYEYQGDNLLLARINLLLTFTDYYEERWEQRPSDKLLKKIANIISWNIWQMDGLKDTVPLGKPYAAGVQLTLFDMFGFDEISEDEQEAVPCRIFNWRSKSSVKFMDLKEMWTMGNKLFDYVIGNPPYQEEFTAEGNKTYAAPVYNEFMDAAYEVGEKVELIHPARFLFNAGSTPKAWNRKMLADSHFKVLDFEAKSSNVFPNTDIKGGVCITYHDSTQEFGAIEIFLSYEELNGIKKKVTAFSTFDSFQQIVYSRTIYRLTDTMHKEHPEAITMQSKGHPYDMSTNIFSVLPMLFHDTKPDDGKDYIQIFGREGTARKYKWIRKDYVNTPENLYKYKIFVPKANGSGAIGEVITTPVIGQPVIGHAESFMSIGSFDSSAEAENCLKYIKSKFARCLLGILKVTPDNPPDKWKYVPMQDFTTSSDIDWSKSIHEIDLQLYRKYGLDEKEIEFIEAHVKEMA